MFISSKHTYSFSLSKSFQLNKSHPSSVGQKHQDSKWSLMATSKDAAGIRKVG